MTTHVFDIETEAWDVFVVGAAVSAESVTVLHSARDCVDWYLSLPADDIVVSHNGGRFDMLYLISEIDDRRWSATTVGSTILAARAHWGKQRHAELRDSFRLFPLSLAKWTGLKEELGLPCKGTCRQFLERGEPCAGYCSISRRMPANQLARLTEYCVQDCVAALERWESDIARLDSIGLDVYDTRGRPRITIGSVAWHTAARDADLDDDAIGWPEYDAGRRAYFGGRTEPGRTHAAEGHRYDVHSMYPWSLTLPVPVGRRAAYHGHAASQAYRDGEPGAYHATVDVGESDLPPLPMRYDGPRTPILTKDRLVWPNGQVEGWYTGEDLESAERHGATILSIDRANVWEESLPIYAPYVARVYGSREQAMKDGDKRWSSVIKWFANALSGKLAQQTEVESAIIVAPGDEVGPPYGALWAGGRVYISVRERISACAHPIQAAYVTARSRSKLLDRLRRHSGRWLYCDTDSAYTVEPDETDVHASALGMWGYDGPLRDWRCLGPKLYAYKDETGKEVVKARGIPDPDMLAFDALGRGETVRRTAGVESLKVADGAFIRRTIARTHRSPRDMCGARGVGPSGVTVPLHRSPDGSYSLAS